MSKAKSKDMRQLYDLDEKKPLGEGSFGKVYRARNKQDKSVEIAIKMISKRGLGK
jgi:serine/threonine protein kinase